MKSSRGMTLLELMLVVAIFGLMASLAVVNIQGSVGGQRESAATRELWSAALRARQLSIATNQPVRIVVDKDVVHPNGQVFSVARWERLKCEEPGQTSWTNDTCPQVACINTTCRTSPDCCSETGQDIPIPASMVADPIDGLCFLPGSGAPALRKDCLQGSLGDATARALAMPNDKSIRFNFTSGRASTLLMVEPMTGLSSLVDCDSVAADGTNPNSEPRSVLACKP
ncbi:pilus assembly FimT family protein [Corallococcus aberystwythensis]|uniref:Type II secretion system protein n=1 Tax=Corallococcus aberystwythensis TaxID=2316722 RepID=A0A3A8PWP6_9BACT|nr:type II secretion system protein [Corallococcus aberystwythensis]RKH59460.1 type II secretion system protein [Corallococcus aberystwythensis]